MIVKKSGDVAEVEYWLEYELPWPRWWGTSTNHARIVGPFGFKEAAIQYAAVVGVDRCDIWWMTPRGDLETDAWTRKPKP
jgi:hypothetical protein